MQQREPSQVAASCKRQHVQRSQQHTALATPALANSRSACGLLIRRPAIATPPSPLLDLGWVSRSIARRCSRGVGETRCATSLAGAGVILADEWHLVFLAKVVYYECTTLPAMGYAQLYFGPIS